MSTTVASESKFFDISDVADHDMHNADHDTHDIPRDTNDKSDECEITPSVRDFVSIFASWHPRMAVCGNTLDAEVYHVVPENQCDWMFTLRRITDRSWKVVGVKDDPFWGTETRIEYYVYSDIEAGWISSTVH